jgi:hypothetical protein
VRRFARIMRFDACNAAIESLHAPAAGTSGRRNLVRMISGVADVSHCGRKRNFNAAAAA